MNYITLAQFKQYQDLDTTDEDGLLLNLIDWSSQFINQWKGRRFDVRVETRLFDRPARQRSAFGVYDSSLLASVPGLDLKLDDDLLQVISLVNGDGETITTADYVLEPANMYPKNRVVLKNSSSVNWESDDDGNDRQVINLTGWWGYHANFANSFQASGDSVQDDPLTINATTVTVTAGATFQAGQMIRIDDELMLISALGETSLTVTRGYNGSTAAQHASGSSITIFKPMGMIVEACLRLVKWRYTQKDTDNFDKTYNMGMGEITIPTKIPADVKILLGARRMRL